MSVRFVTFIYQFHFSPTLSGSVQTIEASNSKKE